MEGVTVPGSGQLFAGDYRVVKPLSAGGMGAVYIVDQLSTGKQRALKLMHPELVADAELRKRFEQEARIGARIESAHVVEVQAAGVDAATGVPWLVMELLAGEDLESLIARDGALPPGELREIFEQICHAVGAAHRAGIIHRDLKPENVFIGRGRHVGTRIEVKVLDFGIAKLVDESGTRGSTAAMGSPAWMAPEQTERTTIDARADVWALGLIAYYALTGHMFWLRIGEKWLQLSREIMLDPIPAASLRAAAQGAANRLPPDFDAWFARCVARDPNARFANASKLCDALLPLLSNAPNVGRTAAVTALAAPTAIDVAAAMAPTIAAPIATTIANVQAPPHAPQPRTVPKKSPAVAVAIIALVTVVAVVALMVGAAVVRRENVRSRRGVPELPQPQLDDKALTRPPETTAPPPPVVVPLTPPVPSANPRRLPRGAGAPRPACTCSAGDPLCACF